MQAGRNGVLLATLISLAAALMSLAAALMSLAAAMLASPAAEAVTTGTVPPPRLEVLKRGVNMVHWFRFPPVDDPASLRGYVSDATLRSLRQAGFTFLRVPIQPELFAGRDGALDPARIALLVGQLRRVQKAGLGVMPELHPMHWRLESDAADRARLVAIWRDLSVALRSLDPELLFPEILNEPVFPDSAAWEDLQARALAAIRASLPGTTVVLSGTHWSDIDGLLKARPPADRNIVYAVHFYEPYVLAAGAPEEPAVDPRTLGRLPFPAGDLAACQVIADGVEPARTRELMRFYCAQRYDRAAMRARFDQARDWSARTGIRLVVNEFGIAPTVAQATRRAWMASVVAATEADGFGWALWGYDDSMGFDLPVTAAHDDAALPGDLLAALHPPAR